MIHRRAILVAAVPVSVATCAAWGSLLTARGARLNLSAAPFVGHFDPRVGLGTPLAVFVAAAVIALSPRLAHQLSWRALMVCTMAGTLAWGVALALVDGSDGIRSPLTSPDEYLADVDRVHDVTGFLSGFTSHVLGGPGHWTTHVSGHPPGFLLLLAGMKQVGLGGPWPAAILCIVVGSSASGAVLVTTRNLAGELSARLAAPFLVLMPAVVWIVVSGDALFLGVSAWSIALLSGAGITRAIGGGCLFGVGLMLTYGLTTLLPMAIGVTVVAWTAMRLAAAIIAAASVLLGFAVLGFWWVDGLHQTLIRYGQGAGGYRPYGYFLLANLVVFSVAVGPAAVAALPSLSSRDRLSWLVLLGLVCVVVADVSGKSKSEVERIWVVFAPWVVIAAARLDGKRGWLFLQAGTGLLAQTLLLSKW